MSSHKILKIQAVTKSSNSGSQGGRRVHVDYIYRDTEPWHAGTLFTPAVRFLRTVTFHGPLYIPSEPKARFLPPSGASVVSDVLQIVWSTLEPPSLVTLRYLIWERPKDRLILLHLRFLGPLQRQEPLRYLAGVNDIERFEEIRLRHLKHSTLRRRYWTDVVRSLQPVHQRFDSRERCSSSGVERPTRVTRRLPLTLLRETHARVSQSDHQRAWIIEESL